MRIMRKQKLSMGWTIADIRGICQNVCMHKILLEKGHKLLVEQQRCFNPIIKKVIKKVIMEWLDGGIIYLISNSS